MPKTLREVQVDRFMVFYSQALAVAVADHPDEYVFKVDMVPTVAARMQKAFLAGTYNHDGRAIKMACKAVGIKHTRTAMEAFFTTPTVP